MLLQQLSCVLVGCGLAMSGQSGIPPAARESWLALLHYRESGGEWVSEIGQASFFLDSTGRHSPQAEWTADSIAFLGLVDAASSREHARCRFPARFDLMRRALAWTDAHLPRVDCSDYVAYAEALSGDVVSVVFASYHLENPSSAFGHVMLSVADNPSTALEGYSVSFEANTTGLSTLKYARQGLLGGLSASYQIAPLFERASRYERQELRDLWLFPLRLPDEAVGQLVRHLWELKDVTYAYGFFRDNCAQKILAVVHAVAPSYGLLPYSPVAVLPSEVVRRLVTKVGMVDEPIRRASLLEQHEGQVSALSSSDRSQLRQMIAGRTVFSEASAAVLSAALSWSELETPSRAFQRQSDDVEHPDGVWRRRLWQSLIASGAPRAMTVPATVPTVRRSLLEAHRPASIAIRSGRRTGVGNVQGVGVRWLLHDVLDSDVGYPPSASVSVAKVEFDVDARGGVNVEEITVLRVERLGLASNLRPQLAWRLDVGGRRLPVSNGSLLHFGLELGVGAGIGVTRPAASVLFYTLVGLRPGVAAVQYGSPFVPAATWTGGLLMQFRGQIRTHVTFEQVASFRPNAEHGSLVGTAVRKRLARNWEIEARARRSPALREVTAGIVAFF